MTCARRGSTLGDARASTAAPERKVPQILLNDTRRVAVERNLAVVRRAHYDTEMVSEGDEVEIVNFVGGG